MIGCTKIPEFRFSFIIQQVADLQAYIQLAIFSKTFADVEIQAVERHGVYIRTVGNTHELEGATLYIVEQATIDVVV